MKKDQKIRIALGIFAILIGFLMALQIKSLRKGALESEDVKQLQKLVLNYRDKNEEINKRNLSLQSYIEQLERDQETGSLSREIIIKDKERYAIFAGLRPVENSGVMIELEHRFNGKMTDSVLRFFVNELSALGAQAIAINDERKVAMTEIRSSSDSILINAQSFPANTKFEIKAITDPAKKDYILSNLKSLGERINESRNQQFEFKIKAQDRLKIPALSEASVIFQYNLIKPES